MGTNRRLLQVLAIIAASLTLVNCSGTPCVFGSNGAAEIRRPLLRAPKAAATDVCPTNNGGGGGGGGGNGCSNTLTPTDVLFGQASTGAITTLAINTGGNNLLLMCTTASAGLGQIVVANPFASGNNFLYAMSLSNSLPKTATISGFAIGHVAPITLTSVGADFTLSGAGVSLTSTVELQADPFGRFLILTDTAANAFHVLNIDSTTGALSEALGSPVSVANPLFTAVDETGDFLYVSDNADGQIYIFDIGLGAQIVSSPFIVSNPQANSPISMQVSGNFLYTANNQSISFYTINGDGSLTTVANSPFTPAPTFNPQLLALDQTGRFLYATGTGTEGVLGFVINANGSLTIIPGGPFAAGQSVTDIVPNPLSGQMYLLNAGVIEVFTVDQNSGALTQVSGASQFASSSNLATASVQ